MRRWTQQRGPLLPGPAQRCLPWLPPFQRHISRPARRKRRAALRLAELTVQGIGLLATLHGAASGNQLPDADKAARSINMPALLARMAAMPSSDIDDADALEAFIRINGLAAAAARSSDAIIRSRQLTVDAAVQVLREFPELRSEAEAQLVNLKRHLT